MIGFKSLAAFVIGYLLLALVGLFPVNRDFEESENGIEIFVSSSSIHSDIIVPIETPSIHWRDEFRAEYFGNECAEATHVAFGWGDRGFYVDTPTWADLKISTAANALLIPSATVMHVSLTYRPGIEPDTKSVRISAEQYLRMVQQIQASFKRDSRGKILPIANASYQENDAFFVANGSYHLFRTCNCWTGNVLENSGVKTGWFTPFPQTPFWYFPDPN